MNLGHTPFPKRPDERLATLPDGNSVNFCLAKRQAKNLPRRFAELSVFVFGND